MVGRVARGVALVVGLIVVAGCGKGAPGGFPGPRRVAGEATTPTPATTTPITSTVGTAVTTTTTNTIAQGSPVPPPTAESPAGDARVGVTLARGDITPSVREVQARRVAFVVSNDDDVPRLMRVAAASGAPLVGTDLIRPDGVATLSVELPPGRYLLVAEGGEKTRASVEFLVSSRS